MMNVERSELVALIALLQNRPDGLSWPDITAEVIANGSAVDTWHQHSPATLFEDPAHSGLLDAATASVDTWADAGLTLLTVLDNQYPSRLRGIHQAPPILFSRGTLVPSDPGVSVVGSRNASDRGLQTAGDISRTLVAEGFTAVAGLAAGIDTVTHRSALDAGGRTVAIIGTGINQYYPAANRTLQDEIGERGLLMSQFWPDAPPQRQNFLMRNATMSGYGLATVIVEAGEHSGTRVQARMAVEHGRTVILMTPVIRQNMWAKELIGRPGVYQAESVPQVAQIVRRVANERLDVGNELDKMILPLK